VCFFGCGALFSRGSCRAPLSKVPPPTVSAAGCLPALPPLHATRPLFCKKIPFRRSSVCSLALPPFAQRRVPASFLLSADNSYFATLDPARAKATVSTHYESPPYGFWHPFSISPLGRQRHLPGSGCTPCKTKLVGDRVLRSSSLMSTLTTLLYRLKRFSPPRFSIFNHFWWFFFPPTCMAKRSPLPDR